MCSDDTRKTRPTLDGEVDVSGGEGLGGAGVATAGSGVAAGVGGCLGDGRDGDGRSGGWGGRLTARGRQRAVQQVLGALPSKQKRVFNANSLYKHLYIS